MSGWIKVRADEPGWIAAGWLFRWVLDVVGRNISDPAIRAELQEIDDENLGALDLTERPAAEREEISAILRTRLLAAAEVDLAHLPDLPGTLRLLQELVDLVARA